MEFGPGFTALDVTLCVLMATSGFLYGRQVALGVGGPGMIVTLALTGSLLVALVWGNLHDGHAPVLIGVLAHLTACFAATHHENS